MTGILAALAGSGSPILDTQTVTSGSTTTGTDPYFNWYGYKNGSPAFGSISDGTSNIYAGAAINGIFFYEAGSIGAGGFYERSVILIINGTQSNSGWSTMTVGTTTYARTDASFSTAGGVSTWTWSLTIANPLISGSPGPFSASTVVTWS